MIAATMLRKVVKNSWRWNVTWNISRRWLSICVGVWMLCLGLGKWIRGSLKWVSVKFWSVSKQDWHFSHIRRLMRVLCLKFRQLAMPSTRMKNHRLATLVESWEKFHSKRTNRSCHRFLQIKTNHRLITVSKVYAGSQTERNATRKATFPFHDRILMQMSNHVVNCCIQKMMSVNLTVHCESERFV